jgi:hypothetical protein
MSIFIEGPNNQISTIVQALMIFTIYLAAFCEANSENGFESQFRHVHWRKLTNDRKAVTEILMRPSEKS